jgi:hypothetical protein
MIRWQPALERPPPRTTAQPETAGLFYCAKLTLSPFTTYNERSVTVRYFPSTNGRLNRVRIKIERAKKHLRDLDAEIDAFRGHVQKVLLKKKDPNTGYKVEQITNLRRVSAHVIGASCDAIHNLRSALDHLAYQLILAAGNTPTKTTGFPIYEDMASYKRYKARKVKGMSSRAIELIDALKPYKRGNDLLWRLHELDNIDKHRMLLTPDEDFLLVADWIEDFFGFQQIYIQSSDPHFSGVFDEQVEKEVYTEIQKAVDKPKVCRRDPMIPTLHQIVDTVEGILECFEPLLR